MRLLELEDFLPLVGQDFAVEADGYDDKFVLIEATPSKYQTAAGMRRKFILVFRSTRTDLRFNFRVNMTHPAIGTHDISLSPLALLPDGRHDYQVWFG